MAPTSWRTFYVPRLGALFDTLLYAFRLCNEAHGHNLLIRPKSHNYRLTRAYV